MNFESEAAVHAFLERQHSERLAFDIERKEVEWAAQDEDEQSLNLPSQRQNGTRLKGAFGELLAKNLIDQENAANENHYTKLEDMFAEEPLTAMFRETYVENPMLMDAPVTESEKGTGRRLRLTLVAGSIGSFISRNSPTKSDGENDASIVQKRSFDMHLPRPKSSRSFRKSSGGGRKSESFSKRNASSREAEDEAEDSGDIDEAHTLKKTRVSLSGIIQLLRTASFTRKDQQLIRDPGPSELPLSNPRRKISSREVIRKASKTTEATDDSRMSSGVIRVLSRFGFSV